MWRLSPYLLIKVFNVCGGYLLIYMNMILKVSNRCGGYLLIYLSRVSIYVEVTSLSTWIRFPMFSISFDIKIVHETRCLSSTDHLKIHFNYLFITTLPNLGFICYLLQCVVEPLKFHFKYLFITKLPNSGFMLFLVLLWSTRIVSTTLLLDLLVLCGTGISPS